MRPALFLCLFLSSGYGRGLRMLAGGLLISLGGAAGGGLITTVLACVGLTVLLEAQFDLCLAAPLLGCPVNGAEVRSLARRTL